MASQVESNRRAWGSALFLGRGEGDKKKSEAEFCSVTSLWALESDIVPCSRLIGELSQVDH